jgi:adhesin/invasin
LSAFTSSGTAITGAVSPVITLSTSDSTDLTLNQTSVSTGASNVVVTYDGKALPSGTTISATSGTVTTSITIVSGATPTPVAAIKTLTIQQLTPVPNVGTAGSFVITVNAVDINGNPIVGSFPTTVSLSTNDTADLTIAPASATVSASGTDVTVVYDGKPLPSNTIISASSGSVSTNLTVTSTAAAQAHVSSIVLTPQGPGNLSVGKSGSFGVAITVNDANGNPISGDYPAPLTLTVNNSTDLSFNTSGSASVTISSSASAGVTVLYDGNALLPGTTITASMAGYSASTSLGITAVNPSYPTPAFSALALTTYNVGSLIYGTSGSFSVVVTAYDSSGNQINSSYPLPVVLTTNDTAALGFTQGGLASTTVSTGNTPVVVLYRGLIPNPDPTGASPPPVIPVPINGDVLTATAQGTNGSQTITTSTTLVHAGG